MIEFDELTHTYKLNSVVVPSVTQCTGLLQDFSCVPRDVLQAAADFGTHVHTATELYDHGVLDEEKLDENLVPWLAAWKRFLAETGFEIAGLEQIVYSKSKRYAGKLDRVGMLNGKKAIIDIKTPTNVSKAAGPQTAGYAQAYEEMTGEKVAGRYAVQLKGDGSYRLIPYKDKNDVHIFNACLSVVSWKMANK